MITNLSIIISTCCSQKLCLLKRHETNEIDWPADGASTLTAESVTTRPPTTPLFTQSWTTTPNYSWQHRQGSRQHQPLHCSLSHGQQRQNTHDNTDKTQNNTNHSTVHSVMDNNAKLLVTTQTRLKTSQVNETRTNITKPRLTSPTSTSQGWGQGRGWRHRGQHHKDEAKAEADVTDVNITRMRPRPRLTSSRSTSQGWGQGRGWRHRRQHHKDEAKA